MKPFSARIDDSCLDRFTRFFNASLSDIFAELFQNARRAGATSIHVGFERGFDKTFRITITDDGRGIADPSLLLDYGKNGWNENTVRNEDAAGLGMLCLATRSPTIVSTPEEADSPSFRLKLTEEHFRGTLAAEPVSLSSSESPLLGTGTAISFTLTEQESNYVHHWGSDLPGWNRDTNQENAPYWLRDLKGACAHFPLPVYLQYADEPCPSSDFLHDCFHVETWSGLRFGITDIVPAHNDPSFNYHGNTCQLDLPRIDPVYGTSRYVKIDTQSCPDLKMVLPARKEIHRNQFIESVITQAKRVLYRSYLACPDSFHSLPRYHQSAARLLDVYLPDAAPMLRPWAPTRRDTDRSDMLCLTTDPEHPYASRPAKKVKNTDCIVGLDSPLLEQPLAWALEREDQKLPFSLFAPQPLFEGYAWYDNLTLINRADIQLRKGDLNWILNDPGYCTDDFLLDSSGDARSKTNPALREINGHTVDSIRFLLRDNDRDNDVATVAVPFAFAQFLPASEFYQDYDFSASYPIFTETATISAGDYSEILFNCFFMYSETDYDEDSHETQERRFNTSALSYATEMLVNAEEGLKTRLNELLREDIVWQVPNDTAVTITIRDRKASITVDRLPDAA